MVRTQRRVEKSTREVVPLSPRVSPEVYEGLREVAHERNVTLNLLINEALEQYLTRVRAGDAA